MLSQRLRQRITVQRKTIVVDANGDATATWADLLVEEPAEWQPGPGREYLAGEALRSEVSGRLTIRWSSAGAEIRAADRVLWDGRLLDVKGPPLPDATARRWLTLMVADTQLDGS